MKKASPDVTAEVLWDLIQTTDNPAKALAALFLKHRELLSHVYAHLAYELGTRELDRLQRATIAHWSRDLWAQQGLARVSGFWLRDLSHRRLGELTWTSPYMPASPEYLLRSALWRASVQPRDSVDLLVIGSAVSLSVGQRLIEEYWEKQEWHIIPQNLDPKIV